MKVDCEALAGTSEHTDGDVEVLMHNRPGHTKHVASNVKQRPSQCMSAPGLPLGASFITPQVYTSDTGNRPPAIIRFHTRLRNTSGRPNLYSQRAAIHTVT